MALSLQKHAVGGSASIDSGPSEDGGVSESCDPSSRSRGAPPSLSVAERSAASPSGLESSMREARDAAAGESAAFRAVSPLSSPPAPGREAFFLRDDDRFVDGAAGASLAPPLEVHKGPGTGAASGPCGCHIGPPTGLPT